MMICQGSLPSTDCLTKLISISQMFLILLEMGARDELLICFKVSLTALVSVLTYIMKLLNMERAKFLLNILLRGSILRIAGCQS